MDLLGKEGSTETLVNEVTSIEPASKAAGTAVYAQWHSITCTENALLAYP